MESSKRNALIAGAYLGLAALSIGYELSIRVFHRGSSEFAGMLSTALTLPSILPVIMIARKGFGVTVGDSDVSFVLLLGLAALANAGILYAALRWIRR